jgi:hypothetical protein
LIAKDEPDPENEPAREALLDKDYMEGMIAYGKSYQDLSQAVWEDHYLRGYDYEKVIAEIGTK